MASLFMAVVPDESDEIQLSLAERLRRRLDVNVVDLTTTDDSSSSLVEAIPTMIVDERVSFAARRRNNSKNPQWPLFRPPRGMKLTTLSLWLSDADREFSFTSKRTAQLFIEDCIQSFNLQGKLREILTKHKTKEGFISQDETNACSYISFEHL